MRQNQQKVSVCFVNDAPSIENSSGPLCCLSWIGSHVCISSSSSSSDNDNQSECAIQHIQTMQSSILYLAYIEAFVIDKKCPKYPLFARLWSLLSPWDDDEDDDKEEEDGYHLFEHLPLYFMSDSTHVEQNFSAQEFTHQSNKRSCEIFVPTYLVLVTFVWWKGQEPERRKRMSIAAAVGVKNVKGEKRDLEGNYLMSQLKA